MNTSPPSKARAPDLDLVRLITEHEAAAFLGFTVRALQNWRVGGGGPLFVRLNGRAVRYRHRELINWAEQHLRSSTSEEAGR